MLTRNLSYKNIPNVFSGFSRATTIAEPLKLVCSPPKITSIFIPRVAYFQWRFFPMCSSSVFFFFCFSQHRVVQKFELLKYSKSFFRFLWRPTTIAKPLPVVCSPPAITGNVRPRVVYFQRRFGPICPPSAFFFLLLLHPTPCCPEIWAVKMFAKFIAMGVRRIRKILFEYFYRSNFQTTWGWVK